MAVIDPLPGLEVAVCVDQKPLHEYADDECHARAQLNMISTYIESETMKEFSVKLVVKEPYSLDCPALSFQLFVDGVKVREPLLTQTAFERCGRNWATFWSGIKYPTEGQNCILRPFRFSKIDTLISDNLYLFKLIVLATDDEQLDTLRSDTMVMGHVGEIVVKVLRRTEAKIVGWKIVQENLLEDYPSNVHEKALKGQAKSHSISLGDGRPSAFSRKVETDFVDGEDSPIATFRFKYRSKEALEALLVIRKPPGPEPEPEQAQMSRTATPEPVNIDVASLTPDTRRQLEEFYQQLQSGTAIPRPEIKQEAKKPVKREREGGEAEETIRCRKKGKSPTARALVDLTLG